MKRIAITAVIGLLATGVSPAALAANRDVSCNKIKKTEDGKFTYSMEPGFSVIRMTAADGPINRDDIAQDVVGFACLRQKMAFDENDIEVLQAGYSLNVGGGGGNSLRMMKLKLEDGIVGYEVTSGALSKKERKAASKVIARMQIKVGS